MRRRHRGQTLPEILFAVGVAVLATLIIVTTAGIIIHSNSRVVAAENARQDVEDLIDQMQADAHSSISIFTPMTCPNGAFGHGNSDRCNSLRFVGKDASGNLHFWGFDYANGVVIPCLQYATPHAACAPNEQGRPISHILSFAATPTLASTLNIPFLNGYTIKDHNYEVAGESIDANCTGNYGADASCRLVAGNRVMEVTVQNAYVSRSVHLLQGGTPFATSIVTAFLQPAKIGNGVTTGASVDPNPQWFWGTSAAAHTENASEVNYSVYETNGAVTQPWWSAGSGSCINLAWNTSTTPSDSTTFTASPTAVGSCGFTISSQDQTSPNIATYVAGPLTAGAVSGTTFTPTSSVTIPWNGSSWGSVTIAGGKTWDANEDDITGVFDGTKLDLSSLQFSGCNGIATISAAAVFLANGATPMSAYGFSQAQLTGVAAGQCTLTIHNPNTGETVTLTVVVNTENLQTPSPGGGAVSGNYSGTSDSSAYCTAFDETGTCTQWGGSYTYYSVTIPSSALAPSASTPWSLDTTNNCGTGGCYNQLVDMTTSVILASDNTDGVLTDSTGRISYTGAITPGHIYQFQFNDASGCSFVGETSTCDRQGGSAQGSYTSQSTTNGNYYYYVAATPTPAPTSSPAPTATPAPTSSPIPTSTPGGAHSPILLNSSFASGNSDWTQTAVSNSGYIYGKAPTASNLYGSEDGDSWLNELLSGCSTPYKYTCQGTTSQTFSISGTPTNQSLSLWYYATAGSGGDPGGCGFGGPGSVGLGVRVNTTILSVPSLAYGSWQHLTWSLSSLTDGSNMLTMTLSAISGESNHTSSRITCIPNVGGTSSIYIDNISFSATY